MYQFHSVERQAMQVRGQVVHCLAHVYAAGLSNMRRVATGNASVTSVK
jgi:hypothetical protein